MRNFRRHRSSTWALVAGAAITTGLLPSAAFADHVPTPTSVTLAGSLQSEVGCPGDWLAECSATHLSDPDADGVWTGTFAVPAGSWEYKVTLNDTWGVNFGANGAEGGANIALVAASDTDVTFSYDHATHVVTAAGDGLVVGGLTEEFAHWLTSDLIAWDVTDPAASYTLHTAPAGGLTISPDGVDGGTDIPLQWVSDSLPADLAAEWPHLAGYALLRVPASVNTAAVLTGALAVSSAVAGASTGATGIQIPGVLDDLYAGAARGVELGVSWNGQTPTLRLWAPTAKSVTLQLFDGPSSGTPVQSMPMTWDPESGVWSTTGTPSWDRQYYLFDVQVYVGSTGTVEHNVVTDPYSLSLAANSAKSQIVDLSDGDLQPQGWDQVTTQAPATPEQIDLYELHVRDFSISDESVAPAHRGTYLAFTDFSSDGMNHLRNLAEAGLTTVHLLPTFDIASIEEVRSAQQQPDIPAGAGPASPDQQAAVAAVADADGFNWGYDPWHFTTPEGSYATDPQGVTRILEYRKMVQGLHQTGLGVVNDVVFNHTAQSGQGEKSVLDRIVPGYYHRLVENGSIATSTCCENTASEHAMMEKLMVDSLVTWATEYKIDGFRFDLMGHHSKDNLLAVRAALDALTPAKDGVDGSAIYLYGEGWNFGEVANNARFVQATQLNMAGTGIGTFSDRLRDAVRGGGPFDEDPGIQGFGSGQYTDPNGAPINGDQAAQLADLLLDMDQIRVGLAGNLAGYTFTDRTGATVTGAQVLYNGQPAGYTADPQENILYIEAHDNETLYDSNIFKLPVGTSMADRVRMEQLALSTVALGQGVSFFHAGAEILRSKSLDRNSYNSGDHFNTLDWSYQINNFGVGLPPAPDNAAKWPLMAPLLADPALKPTPADIEASAARFQDLLSLADSSPLFSLSTAQEIQDKVKFLNTGPSQTPGLIVLYLDDTVAENLDPERDGLVVIFNASDQAQTFTDVQFKGAKVKLSPIQKHGADRVVKKSDFVKRTGTFSVPARTTAVFEIDRRS
jgi:pullulanase-type alpha-1,6-glucosidase